MGDPSRSEDGPSFDARTVFDVMEASVAIYDRQARIVYLNPITERLFGHTREQLVGQVLWELFPEARGNPFHQAFERVLAEGTSEIFDHHYQPWDRWFENRIYASGPWVVVIATDITDRRLAAQQAEQARRDAERAAQRTQRLQEATTALVMAAGPRQVSRELLNLSVEAVQASWGVIGLCSDDGEAVELFEQVRVDRSGLLPGLRVPLAAHMPLTDAIRSRRSVWIQTEEEMEIRYPRGGGSNVEGRALHAGALAITPLISGEGVIGAYALGFEGRRTFAEDEKDLIVALGHISAQALDRTRREEEVRRALELARLAEKRALEANRVKDEFLAMLGHELRNPLAPILSALEVMQLRAPGVNARERMVVERQVRHMTRLIEDLMDVSRIARGKVALQRNLVEVAEVVAKAVEVAGPLIQQRSLTLTTDVPTWGLTVAADEERLRQVLSNLLTNAAKYTEPGGAVLVYARDQADSVIIGVKDTGVGIDPELLPTVFDLFVQGRRSLDRTDGGLGLGLTIVRSLVEAHGGVVSACSEGVGRGSEFIIRLPMAAPESVTPRPLPLPEPAGLAPAAQEGLPPEVRILIVDDNEDAATMMADALGAVGFITRVELNGPGGLAAAAEFRPQVALLDIGLPGMDGYELCRRLRGSQELGAIKVVAVTGYGQRSDRERALRAGFHQHLVKPVDVARMRTLVHELVAPGAEARPPGSS